MYTLIGTGVAAMAISVVATLCVRGFGNAAGMVDKPDGFRKVNARSLPRLGGVAVFVAAFGAVACAALVSKDSIYGFDLFSRNFLVFFGGAVGVFLVGLYDDIYGLRARYKLAFLTLVSAGVYFGGHKIASLSNPIGGYVDLGWLAFPATVLWFVACMNAMNLIDGLDGLASGVALFAVATLLVTAFMLHQTSAVLISVALIGAIAGFLFFNFHPASIFLGDSGSYLLGYLIAYIGSSSAQKSNTVVALLIPVIALGVPFMDTTLAILRRWSRDLPMSAADRQHIHHRLLDMGLSHRQAVLAIYVGCLVLALFALLINIVNGSNTLWVLLGLGVITFVFVNAIARVEIDLLHRRLIGQIEVNRRDVDIRTASYEAVERMKRATDMDMLWDVLCRAAAQVELDSVHLVLNSAPETPAAGGSERSWTRSPTTTGASCDARWQAAFTLRAGDRVVGELTIQKSTQGAPLSCAIPEMAELIVRQLAIDAVRVRRPE